MNYYALYIMGNIGLVSVFSLSALSVIVILIIMPKLSAKFGLVRVMMICTIVGIFGYLLKLINTESIAIVFVSCLLSNMAFYPIWFMASAVVIDTMDYGEWKFYDRAQGILGCVGGIASKVGTAFGQGLLGVFMGMSGFDGNVEVQTQGALDMIVALTTWIPAIICVVMVILCAFYDLDKKLPGIREDLRKRKAAEIPGGGYKYENR